MEARRIPAIIVCAKCNAFYSPPFELAPGISFTMAGNTMSCPSCGNENPIPDGVFGFVEGVFRRISGIPLDILRQVDDVAAQARSAGKSPPQIVDEVTKRVTGIAKFLPKNSAELAAYVAILVTLTGTILQHCKSEKDASAKQQIIIQQTVQVIERHDRDIDLLLRGSTHDAGGTRD